MIKKIIISSLFTLFVFGFTAFGQEKTVVNSQYAKRKLLGRHMLSLQWISWKHFGRAYVRQKKGTLYLKGTQKGRKNSDILTVDGVITEVNRYNFKFNGKITTKVSHINNGETCVREGEMTFLIKGKRKYWRLQDINNPCERVADYVDIYFRR